MDNSVTGLVLTLNGQRLLDQCLASLDFCDELLVVDSQSTDDTEAIATARGARFLVHPWEGPLPQFRYAMENVNTAWVVSLDQDEVLDNELRESLRDMLRDPPDLAGFYVNRRSFYFDRFLKHSGWYPDWLLRVFRPRLMEVTASGAHYSFHPKAPTRRLAGEIVHYPYQSFQEHLEKINYYAEAGGRELRERRHPGGLGHALSHGAFRFFKLYLLKLGILDGRAGFINAAAGAFYAYQKYLRAAETKPWGPDGRTFKQ
jgi:glycosyltransferase involved in cell wall biosynthesis